MREVIIEKKMYRQYRGKRNKIKTENKDSKKEKERNFAMKILR